MAKVQKKVRAPKPTAARKSIDDLVRGLGSLSFVEKEQKPVVAKPRQPAAALKSKSSTPTNTQKTQKKSSSATVAWDKVSKTWPHAHDSYITPRAKRVAKEKALQKPPTISALKKQTQTYKMVQLERNKMKNLKAEVLRMKNSKNSQQAFVPWDRREEKLDQVVMSKPMWSGRLATKHQIRVEGWKRALLVGIDERIGEDGYSGQHIEELLAASHADFCRYP